MKNHKCMKSGNLVCGQNSQCECISDYIPDSSGTKLCIPGADTHVALNAVCDSTKTCDAKLGHECTAGTCKCSAHHRLDAGQCLVKDDQGTAKHGENCEDQAVMKNHKCMKSGNLVCGQNSQCECISDYTPDSSGTKLCIPGTLNYGDECTKASEVPGEMCKPDKNLICNGTAKGTKGKCDCDKDYGHVGVEKCALFQGTGTAKLNQPGKCKEKPTKPGEKCGENAKCARNKCMCEEKFKQKDATHCEAKTKPKPPPTRERQEKKEKETPTSAAVTPIASKILPFFMAMLVVCFFI